MPPKIETKGVNLNTLLIIVSLLSAAGWTVKYGGPILNIPERTTGIEAQIREVSTEVGQVQQTQAVQTQALKTLADIAKDTNDTRREVDRHTNEIEGVKRRLDRLETR